MQKLRFKESEDIEVRCTFDVPNLVLSNYEIYSHITTIFGERETLSVQDNISIDNSFIIFAPRYTIPVGKYKADIIIASTVDTEIVVSETFTIIIEPAVTDLRYV